MATPIEKLKALWQTDIKTIIEEKEKLAEENSKKALEDFGARMVTLETTEKQRQEDIDKINKIIAERKMPTEELSEVGKGGFRDFGDYVRSIKATIIDRRPDNRLFANNERMAIKAPTTSNTQSTITGSEGGFFVPETFSAQIFGDMNQYGKILAKCFQLPVTGPIVRIPALVDYDHSSQTYYSAVSVSRSYERAQITGTSMDFGQVKLELKKIVGLAGLTNELIKWSAISVEPILRRVFASAMAAKLEREIIKGTGAGEMLGIMSSPCKNEVAIESTQSSADPLVPENITHMVEVIADEFQGSTWLHHPKMITYMMLLNKVMGLAGAFTPWFDFGSKTMLTYPSIKTEFCYAPNTTGDIILADLGAYIYAYEAGGEQVMTSPHFYFDYDAEAIRFTMYNDGQFWWKSRRLLDDGSTYVSPVATLGTRS